MMLICGEALYDVFTRASTPEGVLALEARPGGSPLNVAIGLARLGAAVGYFGALSRDALGERLLERLTAEGVETSLTVRTDHPTTLSLVGAKADGTPAYAFYGTASADRQLTAADSPHLHDDIDLLHFGSYALVAEPAADTLYALAASEAGRRLISLDPNVRPTVEPDMRLWRQRISALARHADVIKASVEDVAQLWPGTSADVIAQDWLAQGAALVVVTLGDQGARAYTAGHVVTSPVAPARILDTVGAGDACQAALLNGLVSLGLTTKSHMAAIAPAQLSALLDYAMRAAALACARRGADLPHSAALGPPPRP